MTCLRFATPRLKMAILFGLEMLKVKTPLGTLCDPLMNVQPCATIFLWLYYRGWVSGGAGVQCTPVFQKWGCCTPVFWRTISTDFLNDRRMNNFGDNKYELPSMQQQYNRKVSIIAFVVSICPIFWCPRGGIWEGVYMTLAVAAYHWFLLHWSENLHPRFQIPNSPSVWCILKVKMREDTFCVSLDFCRPRGFLIVNMKNDILYILCFSRFL